MNVWVSPWRCDPPHRISHPEKLDELTRLLAKGWGKGHPALVGYPYGERIQLLSGSHRIVAAQRAHLKAIPLVLWSAEQVEACWGDLDLWKQIMDAPPVNGLEFGYVIQRVP